jgi:sec-independent protein translocase protein TatC
VKFFSYHQVNILFQLKISFYTGLLFSSPFVIGQLILFLLPGLTPKERKNYFTFITKFTTFIWIRASFSYYTSTSCFNFFLSYSEEVLEPFWSFDQYFEFILVLFYSTGLAFKFQLFRF